MENEVQEIKDKCFTLEEVRTLLELQKKRVCFTLGLSSRSFSYPEEYDEIVNWLMNCPLVI